MSRIIAARSSGAMFSAASICSLVGPARGGRAGRSAASTAEVAREARDAPLQLRQPGRIAGRALDQRDPGIERALPVARLQQREAAVEARARVGGIERQRPLEGLRRRRA